MTQLMESRRLLTSVVVANDDPDYLPHPIYWTHHDGGVYMSVLDGVLANDSGYDDDPSGGGGATLTAALDDVDTVTDGELTFYSDGSFLYIPEAGFVGLETFSYVATYGSATSDSTLVTIDVRNDPPSVTLNNTGPFSTPHDLPLEVGVGTINITDVDDPLDAGMLTATIMPNVAHGVLEYNLNGSFKYTPEAGYVGPDSFTVTYTDSIDCDSEPLTVFIDVTNATPSVTPTGSNLFNGSNLFDVSHDDVLIISSPAVQVSDDDTTFTHNIVTNVSHGTLDYNNNGTFKYTPSADYVGPDSFTVTYSDTVPYPNTKTSLPLTIYLNVTNSAPSVMDDDFEIPEPGVDYIDIDVLANDSDMDLDDYSDADDDDLELLSVDPPTGGGTATIVGRKIRYFPPEDYADNDDATLDVFAMATEIPYEVADNVGAIAQGKAKANEKTTETSRTYSRGNDDPAEFIYETGEIKIQLIADNATKKVKLIYKADAKTDSKFVDRPPPNTLPRRPMENEVGIPEYQFYQKNLYLQKVSATEGTVVPAGAPGVNLTFAEGGTGGNLSAELELGSWTTATTISGVAVVQMRLARNGPLATDPFLLGTDIPASATWRYGPRRQTINWSVKVENVDGQVRATGLTLDMTELDYGGVPTPLRLVNSSWANGEVYKLFYPAKPGLARKPNNPATEADERVEPLTPPADWMTKVKVKDKFPPPASS